MDDMLETAKKLDRGARRRIGVATDAPMKKAGSPTTSIRIEDLSDQACSSCAGTGFRADGRVCSCAQAGYERMMEARVTKPCPFCGQLGWCEHRPRDLHSVLQGV